MINFTNLQKQFTRREALKIGAAAALLSSLPVKASAKIDKEPKFLPTGFAPFDKERGMLPGEVMSICSTDTPLADNRTASDILFYRMRNKQLYLDKDGLRDPLQSFFVTWTMLTYPANSRSFAQQLTDWVKLAADNEHKMVMLNTTYTATLEETHNLKVAALEYQIAVIHTRYTLRRYYDQEESPVSGFYDGSVSIQELQIWDHAIWVEPDNSGIDIKVPEFQSRWC